jgi:hypothetical protein
MHACTRRSAQQSQAHYSDLRRSRPPCSRLGHRFDHTPTRVFLRWPNVSSNCPGRDQIVLAETSRTRVNFWPAPKPRLIEVRPYFDFTVMRCAPDRSFRNLLVARTGSGRHAQARRNAQLCCASQRMTWLSVNVAVCFAVNLGDVP